MATQPVFVVARSANRRPTLQHAVFPHDEVNLGTFSYTACGVDIRSWSRAYTENPLHQILCVKCERQSGLAPRS